MGDVMSQIAYKLLSQDMMSNGNTKWEIGVKKIKKDTGNYKMCTNNVFHCYSHPVLALFLNPIHANIENPRIFKIKVDRIVASDGLKQASLEQTIIEELIIPKPTLIQTTAFGIICAKHIYKNIKFQSWANNWLSNEDRSIHAARAAARAAEDAAWAAEAAARAVCAAVCAAEDAARAAAWAAEAAARAVCAAEDAARAAAWAAEDAARACNNKKQSSFLIQAAEQAMLIT